MANKNQENKNTKIIIKGFVSTEFWLWKRDFSTQFQGLRQHLPPCFCWCFSCHCFCYGCYLLSPLTTYPRCEGSTVSAWPLPSRRPGPLPGAQRTHWHPRRHPRQHRKRWTRTGTRPGTRWWWIWKRRVRRIRIAPQQMTEVCQALQVWQDVKYGTVQWSLWEVVSDKVSS